MSMIRKIRRLGLRVSGVGTSRSARQRGSVILVAMTTLSGLLAVAAITLVKVKRGISASSQARFQTVALFAAESGASVGMDFLRSNMHPTQYFSQYVTANNTPSPAIQSPIGLAGNNKLSASSGGLFTDSVPMSYSISILNNATDPGFPTGTDTDGIVNLHVVGRGPDRARVVLEITVDGTNTVNTGRPCPGYAQSGMGADGAGRNDCLTNVSGSSMTTGKPASL